MVPENILCPIVILMKIWIYDRIRKTNKQTRLNNNNQNTRELSFFFVIVENDGVSSTKTNERSEFPMLDHDSQSQVYINLSSNPQIRYNGALFLYGLYCEIFNFGTSMRHRWVVPDPLTARFFFWDIKHSLRRFSCTNQKKRKKKEKKKKCYHSLTTISHPWWSTRCFLFFFKKNRIDR